MRRVLGYLGGILAGWWLVTRKAPPRSEPAPIPPGREFEVLSLLAHELKTPVNVVVGYVELLAEGIPEPLPGSAEAQVANARRASLDLAELVNDLLTYVRLRAGQEQIHAEMIPVSGLVEEASVTAAERAAEKGIELTVDAPADVLMVTDVPKACQALRTLVSNAVKFTDSGMVSVRAETRSGHVRFVVADTGIGIEPADLRAIFEPHWQADRSVRRPRGGTGIGLALCREVARLLGGSVTARSEPGVGSTFVMTLPRRLDPRRFRSGGRVAVEGKETNDTAADDPGRG